ncbi:MAG: GHMP kinase [Flavobacteriales bacterium]|nr:GHMP kinase [Flavobacteriia bacterium]NCP05723.1 GHMP kinase [Flavobacteriales bacterium]PIV92901.1 MAG: GHMP kinase [Flavobacteriaceae bacterium CG17_big_fil_post_rev_8_21_14_2_50_33_15]PIY12085.1 MAG: GHMP kinase [Flavobacteriaceae bacterium CG_4_10_14_3_um_filter_33_47]PJB19250.1 MAG: GHMP kinase [Flavobacteriaceae bacterium CG_4_9_14_3_um_filter_33_16]
MNTKTYYSNGKLLISGEYAVLDGAVALAVPTAFGQSLVVEAIDYPKLIWKSFDEQGTIWYEEGFLIDNLFSEFSKETNDTTLRLIQIFKSIKQLNPSFLNSNTGYKISTHLDFKKDWGLGTSSTLINNLAQWTHVDAYKLLQMTFGGSGYDIACAQHNKPISYQLNDGKPYVSEVNFNPSFKECLYFVYLNKKQNSREGIKKYKLNQPHELVLNDLSKISHKLMVCKTLSEFETLITLHEEFISEIIKQQPIKQELFNDFKGSIKSLGAWGGDFILVASKKNPASYFKSKGFKTIIPYKDMVL